MDIILINKASIILFSGLLIIAALQDISEYKISNKIVLAILVLAPVYIFTNPSDGILISSILTGLIFFMIGICLFKFGYMGGGDVKLISVSMLLLGLEGLLPFIIGMGLAGGILALFMLSPYRLSLAHLCAQMGFIEIHNKMIASKLPYGVAICAGGLFANYLMFTSL